MGIFHFLSILFALFSITAALSVDCEFKNFDASFGELYTCEPEEFVTFDDDNLITDIKGEHTEEKTSNDVKQFYIFNQSVPYFPGGLAKNFPNLESIVIRSSSLKFFYKSDLAGLSMLKFFDLSGNVIEILPPKLFEDSSELQELHFNNNQIRSISDDLLDSFNDLKVLELSNNICVKKDSDVRGLYSNMNDIKKNLMVKCPMNTDDATEASEKQLEKLLNQVKVLETRLEDEVNLKKVSILPDDEEETEKERLNSEIERLKNDKEYLEVISESVNQTNQENDIEINELKEELKTLKENSVILETSLNQTKVEYETLEAELNSTIMQKDEKFLNLEAEFNSTNIQNEKKILNLEVNLEKSSSEKKQIEKAHKTMKSVNQQLKKKITIQDANKTFYEDLEAKLKKLESNNKV